MSVVFTTICYYLSLVTLIITQNMCCSPTVSGWQTVLGLQRPCHLPTFCTASCQPCRTWPSLSFLQRWMKPERVVSVVIAWLMTKWTKPWSSTRTFLKWLVAETLRSCDSVLRTSYRRYIFVHVFTASGIISTVIDLNLKTESKYEVKMDPVEVCLKRKSFLLYCAVYPSETASQTRTNVRQGLILCIWTWLDGRY